MGDGLVFWLATFFFINLASIPLAIWKLIDIAIWLFTKEVK